MGVGYGTASDVWRIVARTWKMALQNRARRWWQVRCMGRERRRHLAIRCVRVQPLQPLHISQSDVCVYTCTRLASLPSPLYWCSHLEEIHRRRDDNQRPRLSSACNGCNGCDVGNVCRVAVTQVPYGVQRPAWATTPSSCNGCNGCDGCNDALLLVTAVTAVNSVAAVTAACATTPSSSYHVWLTGVDETRSARAPPRSTGMRTELSTYATESFRKRDCSYSVSVSAPSRMVT